MSLRVRRTHLAEADFGDLWLWIAQSSGIEAAERMTDRIQAAEDRLGDYPEIGQARPDLAPGLRHWPDPPFLILYRVEPAAISIIRIVHGARDLPSLFDA
jgi:toxin ParE1/3/4